MRHWKFTARAGDEVKVVFTARARVRLMDKANYAAFFGGHCRPHRDGWEGESPVYVPIPRAGEWHLPVDFNSGTIDSWARMELRPQVAPSRWV